MSTLSESSLRALLPQRGPATGAATEPSIAGTIVNTNPPASGPGDALIFDPDENITYDPLQTMTRTNEVPSAPQVTINRSRNVIDVEPTTAPASSGSFGMGFWIVLVAGLLILSFVVFLFMRSSSSGPASQQVSPQVPNSMNQFYGR